MSRRFLIEVITLTMALAVPASAWAQNPRLVSISLSPTQVFWGQAVTGTVTLDQAAPSGGTRVEILNCNSSFFQPNPEGFIVVPAGQTSVSFQATTNPGGTGFAGGPSGGQTCLRAASVGYTVQVESNKIEIAQVATYISLPVTEALGGRRLTGQVHMGTHSSTFGGGSILLGAFPAPRDIAITLGSNGSITFPTGTQVTIRAGTTSASFDAVLPDVPYDQDQRVTKSGGGAYETFAIVKVKVNNVAALSVSPTTIAGGGRGTGTVTLYGTAGAGSKVKVWGVGASLSIPAEITVPEGQPSATFPIQVGSVTTAATVTLHATRFFPAVYTGPPPPDLQAGFSVTPGQMASLTLTEVTLNPAVVRGGTPTTARVKLSSAAPAGGMSINLYRLGGCCADIPTGVTVPAGANFVDFPVRTAVQVDTTTPEIQAALFQSSKSAVLRVTGIQLEAFEVPRSVYSGGSIQIKVRLSAAPPQCCAMAFALSSTDQVGLPVPSFITVPSGQHETAVTVQMPAAPVEKSVTVRLRRPESEVDVSVAITVKPPRQDLMREQRPERIPLQPQQRLVPTPLPKK